MYDEELFLKDQINEDFKNFDTIVEEMLLDLDD
jgi:enamine deaminase RidA (YjgF/YER057c/UK114 family)